ncbi:MAG: F0F1 ATP synthase subunit [Phycisphaera sp.]|nr:F0F1 ATP synthase subunit [Phycisphaera sp.]
MTPDPSGKPSGNNRTTKPTGKQDRPFNPWALAGAGMEVGLTVIALTALGWWLDGLFDTKPWLLIVGMAIGVIGSTYKLYRIGKRSFD